MPITDPSDIAGLEADYDADGITGADLSAVATWPDSSGNGRDATQGTGSRQPTLHTDALNGHSIVRFDGSADYLAANAVATALQVSSEGTTIYAVCKRTSAHAGRIICGFHSSGANRAVWDIQNDSMQVFGDGFTTTEPTDEWRVWTLFNNRSSNIRGFRQDYWHHVERSNSDVFSDANQFSIGQEWDGGTPSDFFGGDMARLLVYSGKHTDAQHEDVTRYLAGLYDLTIAEDIEDPSDLPGLLADFRAAALADTHSEDDPVATLPDQTANGYDATQSTGTKQPTFKSGGSQFGGGAYVSFDEQSDQSLNADAVAVALQAAASMTIFGHIHRRATAVGQCFLFLGAGGSNRLLWWDTNLSTQLIQYNSSGSEISRTTLATPSNSHRRGTWVDPTITRSGDSHDGKTHTTLVSQAADMASLTRLAIGQDWDGETESDHAALDLNALFVFAPRLSLLDMGRLHAWVGANPTVPTASAGPPAPTDLTATTQPGPQVLLEWTDNAASEATGQWVHRSTTDGFTPSASTRLNHLDSGVDEWADTTVELGNTYHYVIEAYA